MSIQQAELRLSRPKPVLMTPIRRCGSHALRLRLNLSPDFYSPYPMHIVDFMPLVKLYGDLNNEIKVLNRVENAPTSSVA